MFVDFVHVHPLGSAAETPGSQFASVLTSHGATAPEKPCAVCQWLRADTGLQTPITSAVVSALVATDLVLRPSRHPVQTIVLTRDLRGPPRQLAV